MMNKGESDPANLVSLESLPAAARRWLERSLPKEVNTPSTFRIEQEGELKIRERWMSFKAKATYTMDPVSFNWQARLRLFPGVWAMAEDGHADGHGWGGARLWGVISMGFRKDPEVYKTQLIRNLGELPWIPFIALVNRDLVWKETGSDAFEIRLGAGDQEIMVRFEVDEDGDIVRAFSPTRPYDVPGGYAEAPWHYVFGDHREIGDVRIPVSAVATYDKNDGAWEYYRGSVVNVTYENN
jgi:hypothetical protein